MLSPSNHSKSSLSSAHGQVRRRRSGNFLRSLAIGSLVMIQSTRAPARMPTRRLRCLRHSRLQPLTSRAHTHRHPRIPSRWHSELLQAIIRRLPSRPTQRAPSRFAVLDARAIPPRLRRLRYLRRRRRRLLLPHPQPLRPYYRTHRHLAAPPASAPPYCGTMLPISAVTAVVSADRLQGYALSSTTSPPWGGHTHVTVMALSILLCQMFQIASFYNSQV